MPSNLEASLARSLTCSTAGSRWRSPPPTQRRRQRARAPPALALAGCLLARYGMASPECTVFNSTLSIERRADVDGRPRYRRVQMTRCLATQHHHRTKTARSSCFKAIDFRSCLGLTCQSYCTIKKRDNTMWSRGHRTLVHVCASTPPLTADGRSERSTVLLGGRQIQEKLLSRGRTFFWQLAHMETQ